MSFKDMVEADNKSVFLNADEFGEMHTVVYDGECFIEIPIVLMKIMESEHTVIPAEGVDGIHKLSAIAKISQKDLNGRVPEQDQIISIDDGEALGHPFYQKYRIITSNPEMGIITLELEAFDE